MAADIAISELKAFGRALRLDEKLIFDEMLKKPLKHYGTISYASSIHAWAVLLLSIMLEHEKRIREMEGLKKLLS